jgi:hypothetical protein
MPIDPCSSAAAEARPSGPCTRRARVRREQRVRSPRVFDPCPLGEEAGEPNSSAQEVVNSRLNLESLYPLSRHRDTYCRKAGTGWSRHTPSSRNGPVRRHHRTVPLRSSASSCGAPVMLNETIELARTGSRQRSMTPPSEIHTRAARSRSGAFPSFHHSPTASNETGSRGNLRVGRAAAGWRRGSNASSSMLEGSSACGSASRSSADRALSKSLTHSSRT